MVIKKSTERKLGRFIVYELIIIHRYSKLKYPEKVLLPTEDGEQDNATYQSCLVEEVDGPLGLRPLVPGESTKERIDPDPYTWVHVVIPLPVGPWIVLG